MKRAASFDAFFPDIDLSQDYQVRFSSQDPKRYRQSSEEPTFFSVSFSKKVQSDNLVPTLLAVNGPDKCLLEVTDETSRQLVCEGSLEEGEAECFMYFDPETNEFVITELEENYVFGEAHDPNKTQFEDADLMAALVPSPKAPNGFVAQSASNYSLVSPRPSNGSNSSKTQAPRVNGVSRVSVPAPKVPSPKPITRAASREESAPRPSRPEPVSEKAPVRKTSPVAPVVVPSKSVPVKPAVVARPPSPKPAPPKPATPKPVTPKPDSPKAIDDEFDLMDMIGQDADSEPEKITEDNLFGFDEDDFQEVKTDSESEPEAKPVPKVHVAKQASPERLSQRKKAPAKKAALSSSSGSSSSSSGSSSSGSSSSSSGSGSSSSGSDSSSDSDSDSDLNKKKAKKPLKQAPVSKPVPAKKTPSPAQASVFAEEDMFAFDENDYDKTDIFDFGPSGHADSDDEFKAISNSITNADLPTTDEDEPAPKTIPPPKEDLNSSDFSSDNDQRYAKVDLAFIDDDQFDIV